MGINMKKAILTALAVTIAAASPALALKTSTIKKYVATSPAAQQTYVHVKKVDTQSGGRAIQLTIESPDTWNGIDQLTITDNSELFGLSLKDTNSGTLLYVDYTHPILIAYQKKKGKGYSYQVCQQNPELGC